MSNKMVRQTIFTAGETDVNIWKRTDVKAYLSAAQSLRNMQVSTIGIAKKRPGTKRLIDVSVNYSENSRMYEFLDKNGNYYLVLSSNLKFSFFLSDSLTGNLTFISTIDSPYNSSDLPIIDYALDNDVLILSHPNYPPARIYISSYNANPLLNQFNYLPLNIRNFPTYDFSNIDYSNYTVALSGSGVVGATLIVTVTNGSSPTGFTVDWVKGQIVGIGATPEQPIGYANITAVDVTNPNSTVFTTTVVSAFGNVPGSSPGSQFIIKQPAWSNTLGWPAKVMFYQNRLWFANTLFLPATVFGSCLNQPTNFDVGIGNDAQAIIYTLGQNSSGPILWLNSGNQFEIFTQNYEFAAPQDQNNGLTPSTFSIRQQSSNGCSSYLKPTGYINDSYYASKTGRAIINYHFDGIGQTYSSTNISAQATHLIKNPIKRALIRGTDESQDNFIYFLNSDNTVTSFQFASEYKLAAFTPIYFDTQLQDQINSLEVLSDQINVFDICTINNRVYFLKQYINLDPNTQIRVTEDFNVRITEDGNIRITENSDNFSYGIDIFDNDNFIDSNGIYQMDIFGNVTGLEIYNGYYVQVLFNNQDYGIYLVINGQISVFNPNNYSGQVIIGFLYNTELIPMYMFSGAEKSNYFKNISRIFVDYYQSLNFYINGTLVNYQNFSDIQDGLPLSPMTDTAIISPVRGWNRFDTFSITQSAPFDLQILGIAYQITDSII